MPFIEQLITKATGSIHPIGAVLLKNHVPVPAPGKRPGFPAVPLDASPRHLAALRCSAQIPGIGSSGLLRASTAMPM